MVICYLDTLKKSSKMKETRLKKGIVEELQQPSYGVINKGCLRIRGEGGRDVRQKWANADRRSGVDSQMWMSAWKKNYTTILVKFTQINEIFSFSMQRFWNTCIFVWPIMPVCHIYFVVNPIFWNAIFGIRFFTLQCESFTSCNISNNASLVSAWTGGGEVANQMWTNLDRGRGSQKVPNLCGHPLSMTPTVKRAQEIKRLEWWNSWLWPCICWLQ